MSKFHKCVCMCVGRRVGVGDPGCGRGSARSARSAHRHAAGAFGGGWVATQRPAGTGPLAIRLNPNAPPRPAYKYNDHSGDRNS